MATLCWEELISEDTEARSDIELEQCKDRLSKDAVLRSNGS